MFLKSSNVCRDKIIFLLKRSREVMWEKKKKKEKKRKEKREKMAVAFHYDLLKEVSMQETRVKGAMGFLRDFWIPRNFIVARRGPFPPWNFLTSSKKKNPSSLIGLVHSRIRIQLCFIFSPFFFRCKEFLFLFLFSSMDKWINL